jgi:hypothetical protein
VKINGKAWAGPREIRNVRWGGRRRMRIAAAALLLIASLTARAGALELVGGRLLLRFGADGRPASLRTVPVGAELLDPRHPGAGFYLEGPDHARNALRVVAVDEQGRLTARSADGRQEVRFRTRATDRALSLYLDAQTGVPSDGSASLHFELNGSDRMRVTELDYMTRVQNEPYGVRAHWDELWHQVPGDPRGGIALFTRTDEADEDETLLRLWVDEPLAHPRVDGAWTLERARTWLADWQQQFASRSQMIVEGETWDELRAALPWARRARIDEIYLFTQTWRTDNFWPGANGNLHVNRRIFPRGEPDLRAFSDELRAQGLRLNLHYVSGGIGCADPTYVGAKPDPRLAGWVRGTLARSATSNEAELLFQPAAGAAYPPALPHFFEHRDVRIGDEIVRAGSFEPGTDGTWLLKRCQRGRYRTAAAAHAAGTEAQGLVLAYEQNYVPDNDSTLLDEMASRYAEFLNRCGIAHAEYDGAEIHTYNGRWGYRKFATRVYQHLDHPVTAHDSSGGAPRAHYEYRFNSSQRILRGTCRFTHGNWSAPVQLASPSRVASTVLDANFVLSQGHRGGALGLCKPEPMFAVSDAALRNHGLHDELIETLLNWKGRQRAADRGAACATRRHLRSARRRNAGTESACDVALRADGAEDGGGLRGRAGLCDDAPGGRHPVAARPGARRALAASVCEAGRRADAGEPVRRAACEVHPARAVGLRRHGALEPRPATRAACAAIPCRPGPDDNGDRRGRRPAAAGGAFGPRRSDGQMSSSCRRGMPRWT